ncbi:MAG: hypothetical protein RMJ98_02980 [Myxococcales bacterium]|nr:hypothetical protein [Polyangiaceae bacterium]MDW8248254.1 hypothetical protein [Myxococcales bacterium]
MSSVVSALLVWQRMPAERPCASPFDAASEGWDPAAQERVRKALLNVNFGGSVI